MQRVFVGDVQGCGAELDELWARADARFGDRWELWSVGDLVNRGPDNLELLARVRDGVERGRCRYVLGNHEISLLRTAWGLRDPQPLDTFQDVLDDPHCDDWIQWLRRRPLAETGQIGDRPFAMVHAGVAPSWDLDGLRARARAVEARLGADDEERARELLASDRREDPVADDLARLTRCRTADAKDRWSSREPDHPDALWHRAWSARGHDYGVVYGHHAVHGLVVAPGLRGLDTGCVHFGRLTAWVPDAGRPDPFALPDDGFWQVDAKRRYYDDAGPIRP